MFIPPPDVVVLCVSPALRPDSLEQFLIARMRVHRRGQRANMPRKPLRQE